MSEEQESLFKNFQDTSSFQLDQRIQDEAVLEKHQELITSYWPEIAQKQEEFPKKINFSSTHFKDPNFYPLGIDISLWNLGPRLCIVATSENVSLVGGIWMESTTVDGFIFNVGINEQCPRTSLELRIAHLRKQKDLQELLINWAACQEEKKAEAKDEYLRLTNYSINDNNSDPEWKNKQGKVNPLVYLTFQAMHHYLMKNELFFEKEDPLICWLYKNAVMPMRSSISAENC